MSKSKIGKREYLNNDETKDFMIALDIVCVSQVNIPRIRHSKRQEFKTLINEEVLLLAKLLRHEKKDWIPRLPTLSTY
jgi:hypothetical protein